MMGATLIEKIIRRNVHDDNVKAGDIVFVKPDRVMIHDIFIPFVADKFHEMGFKKVWDPEKVVIIYDHMVPASQVDDTRHFRIGDAFAKEQGIEHIHRADGVCHQLMPELRYVTPGDVVFGTDSHTVTYGGVGAFSTGIGYTEMAGILGTGELWIKVPETIRVNVNGKLPKGVTSKDVILTIIGDLTAAGATYKSMEFAGDTFDAMSVSERLTMANMTIEAGAKCGLFFADEKTAEFSGVPCDEAHGCFRDEGDGDYVKVLNYKAEDFVPVAACPSQVDKIRPISELKDIKIDQVFIGSCTNGRLEDLRAAAEILKGKHVAPYVKLIITPASRSIYIKAIQEGLMKIFNDAGAIIMNPGCGLCCGRSGGILTDGETVVATNNRNFLGRMGTNKVNIYLASPVTAAHSAVAGFVTSG